MNAPTLKCEQGEISPDTRAAHATATAFLNAYLREWEGWTLLTQPSARASGSRVPMARMPLTSNNGALLIAMPFKGHFRYQIQLPFIREFEDGKREEIELFEAIALLVKNNRTEGQSGSLELKLLERILNSQQNMAEAFARDNTHSSASLWNFQEAETALLSGHPTHPNPRSKDGMNLEESKLYSPEQNGQFALFWVLADKTILSGKTADERGLSSYLQQMVSADSTLPPLLRDECPQGFVPVPWHPLQARDILKHPAVCKYIAEGKLIPVGVAGKTFTPTGSTRGVHGWHAPYMLKFSLGVRLTNSMRFLSRKEVERGIQICQLMKSPVGEAIHNSEKTLTILEEPAYLALQDQAGDLLEESLIVLRSNPFQDSAEAGPLMLASLCEERLNSLSPLGEVITERAQKTGQTSAQVAAHWLTDFLKVAIAPVLRIRARHGLLFGSHQQNMMVSLANGLPVKCWIRDCQGTGHLTSHHDELAKHLPNIGIDSNNIASPQLGNALLCYYVIVNNLMNIISTLAIDGHLEEQNSYCLLHTFLKEEHAACDTDPTFYEMLLNAQTLCSKANFKTSFSGVNEASGGTDGQLASFIEIPNPLVKIDQYEPAT
ncbi:IucA/IucC family protein [Flexibacterium corallicola]|uniref:IucA/IucC family protein n=1 Tax=Flexibacterium corallicola TaxID=3037259 RepID=UPI00286EE238|nr:IucA/IucC family protein [Pseudovibrio sp. M1P-2-3]